MKRLLFVLFGLFILSSAVFAQQNDAKGCEDHPLFTRMPGYWIHNCDQREFNTHPFRIAPGQKQDVEGRYWRVSFYPQNTLKPAPSDVQILRNFENAIAKLGGRVVHKEKGRLTLLVTRNGKETWAEVTAEFTGKYGYTIVEKGEMKQDIVANAEALSNELNAVGHTAVFGIYFDTGKSDLKPESNLAIEEVAKLMRKEGGLKLYIVGHTDNVGAVEANMTLSEQRARSVVLALEKQHGIAAARLRAFGNGPYAPVSTNGTEDGRSRNRRVEIVKQ